MTQKPEIPRIVLITETRREHIARDLSTVAIFILLWSLGHYAESAALEWAGVMCAFFILFHLAGELIRGQSKNSMTPDEARAWLDEEFPSEARDK